MSTSFTSTDELEELLRLVFKNMKNQPGEDRSTLYVGVWNKILYTIQQEE